MNQSLPLYKYKFRFVIVFVFLLSGFAEVKAQFVPVPDAAMKNALIAKGFGPCMNGNSIDSTCSLVVNTTYLEFDNKGITDLSGIEAFVNLQDLYTNDNNYGIIYKLPKSLYSFHSMRDHLSVIQDFPDSLRTLTCWYNLISSFQAPLPDSLKYFNCSYNYITALPSLPNSLETLWCEENNLTTLPPLPTSLKVLNCPSNDLISLPSLPNSLIELYCSFNKINNIPNFPLSIKTIICSSNKLASLPIFPSGAHLATFYCGNNLLTDLSLPDSVDVMGCNINSITQITHMSDYGIDFNLSNNLLTGFSSLPSSLKTLSCDYNQITNLPALPAVLTSLSCASNQISSLPALPSALKTLACARNTLTFLPQLPSGLTALSCPDNQLTSLPAFPSSLITINCSNNQLTQIPELPPIIDLLWCDGNSNLSCLPQLKKINQLKFGSTAISCLPNYGTVTSSSPLLSSLPLCDFFNSNSCSVFWNISGKTYFDSDANCLFNGNDFSQSNYHILLFDSLENLKQQAFTGKEGYYSFQENTLGKYKTEIDTNDIPFTVLCPSAQSYSDSLGTSTSLFYNSDFSLKCKNGFDLAAWNIFSYGFRPGHQSLITLRAGDYSNLFDAHCASGISGFVKVIIDGPATYAGVYPGSLIPSINGDTLLYQVSGFGTVEKDSSFRIYLSTDTTAILGDNICLSIEIGPYTGDNNTSNNFFSACYEVRSSFDPNEKSVSPAQIIDPNGDRWLNYTVQFQNTGNVAAEHIYIIDTLDTQLDLSTFQITAYSHQAYVQVLDGGIAKFNFPNINLPDSNSNESQSHGFVSYKIKAKSTLTVGSVISNTAYIYFDFNAPVITNIVSNTVTLCTADIKTVNAEICQPNSYDFYGSPYSQTGIYFKHFTTAIGCDSIVKLNLNVLSYNYFDTVSVCHGQNFIWVDDTIKAAGNYEKTFSAPSGCDSIVHLNFLIEPAPVYNIFKNICSGQSYQLGSLQLTQTGNYQDTLKTINNCDSVVNLTLVIDPPPHYYFSKTICKGQLYVFDGDTLIQNGNYTKQLSSVAGCDSIVTLHFTITPAPVYLSNVSICSGQTYSFGQNLLSQTGFYSDTLSTTGGCDSIVSLSLTVMPDIVNTGVISFNSTMLIGQASASTFQWIDCATGNMIPGATSQLYIPSSSTNYYSVIVSTGPCSDTSLCYSLSTITAIPETEINQINIFPNPSDDKFIIVLPAEIKNKTISYEVYDLPGREISNSEIETNRFEIDAEKWRTGIYLLKIKTEKGMILRKLIKD